MTPCSAPSALLAVSPRGSGRSEPVLQLVTKVVAHFECTWPCSRLDQPSLDAASPHLLRPLHFLLSGPDVAPAETLGYVRISAVYRSHPLECPDTQRLWHGCERLC